MNKEALTQIPGHLKKRMKELPISKNICKNLSFENEKEFAKWFEKNLIGFGFESIKGKYTKSCPDYIVTDLEGREVKVELEIVSKNFIKHKHNPKDVDIIISVYTMKDKILGIPVFSLYYGFPTTRTTIKIREVERDWLERLKRKHKLKNYAGVIQRLRKLITKHKMVEEF